MDIADRYQGNMMATRQRTKDTIRVLSAMRSGNKAKELYRSLTGAAKTEEKTTGSYDSDYDAINCRFMIKLSFGQYYFCGRFRIQKRSGLEYISVKTGALHDDTVLYEIKDAEDFVYDRVMQITGIEG